jgi:WD40 repeat protein
MKTHNNQPDKLRPRVFISYSRKDRSFVDALLAALGGEDFDTYVDRLDIAPGEDWRARLDSLVVQADIVLFVLTDSSIESEVCSWEIERTLSLGKRLLPLVHGPRKSSTPEKLAALNFIFSDAPGNGESAPSHPSSRALELIRQAVNADIAWIREHTRLTARAVEWASAVDDRKRARLLREAEAKAAREWATVRPGSGAPPVSGTLLDFIAASESHEAETRVRLQRAIGRGFVKPAAQALAGGGYDASLRLLATGAVLAEDRNLDIVPELVTAAARAAFERPTIAVLWHESEVVTAAFNHNSSRTVTVCANNIIRVWDIVTRAEIVRLVGHEGLVHSAVFSPDGRRVVTASDDRTARVWDAFTGDELHLLHGHDDAVISAAFSSDGTRIVTASQDKTALVWDASVGYDTSCLRGHGDWLLNAVFSADGARVLTTSLDHSSRVWDAITGKEIARFFGHRHEVNTASFSLDGAHVVTAGDDGMAFVWEIATGARKASLRGHARSVRSVAFSTDGSLIVTASDDRTARVWDARTGIEAACLSGHEGPVNTVAFSPDGTRVLTASADGDLRIWDTRNGQEARRFIGHAAEVKSAAFNHDGTRIISVSTDCTARVWDAALRMEVLGQQLEKDLGDYRFDATWITHLPARDGSTRAARTYRPKWWGQLSDHRNSREQMGYEARYSSFDLLAREVEKSGWISQDYQYVMDRLATRIMTYGVFSFDETFDQPELFENYIIDQYAVRIWETESVSEIQDLEGHIGPVNTAFFSRDGTRVVTASDDGSARVWDAAKGFETAILRGHRGPVRTAVFSRDGSRVVTASEDRTARVWDVVTGDELALLQGHEGKVNTAIFSPDGKRTVTASDDRTARVWDVVTGAEIARLEGHEEAVTTAAFTSDGARVHSETEGGTVRLWDVSKTRAVNFGCETLIALALIDDTTERHNEEADDLLMKEAPDDLTAAFIGLTTARDSKLVAAAKVLASPLHPNCYLPLSQFAGPSMVGVGDPGAAEDEESRLAEAGQDPPSCDVPCRDEASANDARLKAATISGKLQTGNGLPASQRSVPSRGRLGLHHVIIRTFSLMIIVVCILAALMQAR